MIDVLVVVYNTALTDSAACRSLLEQKEVQFRTTVYDNSDSDFGNEALCRLYGWRYLGGTGNVGLSKAYNAAVDILEREENCGHLCLLDDDTVLPQGFLASVRKETEKYPDSILLPMIFQNGKLLSPWRETELHSAYFRSEEQCKAEAPQNLLAFNSGMTIPISCFREYRYDERLFLDGVDIRFLKDMKFAGKNIRVMPIRAEQDFSGTSKTDKASALSRFRIYLRDSKILYEDEPARYAQIAGRRALHLAMTYHTAEPLRCYLKSLNKQEENDTL